MSFAYVYDEVLDFPGGKCYVPKLAEEVQRSSIKTALESISRSAGKINVVFKVQLDAADKTTLDNNATGPAGGLIAVHDNVPYPPKFLTELASPSKDAIPKVRLESANPSYELCDRDFVLKTCVVQDSFEDLKVVVVPGADEHKRVDWGEVSLIGVFRGGDVAGYLLCANQAEADASGVLSVWQYQAKNFNPPSGLIPWEIRNGYLHVASGLTAPKRAHQFYAVGAPGIPSSVGGRVPFFDGYLEPREGGVLASENADSKTFDPTASAEASKLRMWMYHPSGSKMTHYLRLTTYRPSGTW